MPSTKLKNLVTNSGWTIIEKVSSKQVSGGNHCTRYVAHSDDGRIGFLKAMDLVGAFNHARENGLDELDVLSSQIKQYKFEQSILQQCKDRKMSKVIMPLDSGYIDTLVCDAPLNRVYYVIFEMAQNDLRQQFIEQSNISWVSLFRALQHTAIGVNQLHKGGIAHQDVKPSNVLFFDKEISKIGDLGRVTTTKGDSPFNRTPFTGDPRYAPLEYDYSYNIGSTSFSDRRLSDLFMVGSLIYHMIMGTDIKSHFSNEAHLLSPFLNSLSYSEALPFYITAFTTTIERFENHCLGIFGPKISNELKVIVFEMCYPCSSKRGNPKHQNTVMRLLMERYVGKLSQLVRLAIIEGMK